MAAKTINTDSKTIRAFFLENADLVPENDKTVGPDSAGRGRLSKDARAVFLEHNPKATFVEGQAAQVTKTVDLSYTHVQPSGRKVNKTVSLLPAEIRALVPDAPARGKMSAATLEAAGEAYSAKVQAERESKPAKAKAAKVPAETTESE